MKKKTVKQSDFPLLYFELLCYYIYVYLYFCICAIKRRRHARERNVVTGGACGCDKPIYGKIMSDGITIIIIAITTTTTTTSIIIIITIITITTININIKVGSFSCFQKAENPHYNSTAVFSKGSEQNSEQASSDRASPRNRLKLARSLAIKICSLAIRSTALS